MKERTFDKSAIVLCSGGIDSVATAYYVKKRLHYNNIIILFFNYAQKSLRQERKCARACAIKLKAEFIEISLPELAKLSTSLINIKKKIKKLTRKDLKDTAKESKKWYVPNRNAIFINYALALAESLCLKTKSKTKRVYDIFVGFKNEGEESYPDTTREFVDTMNKLAKSISIKSKLSAPLIKLDKEDIIKLGNKLGVDFRNTYSCYVGNSKNSKGKHCGYCLACRLRQEGFYWANIKDPTKYKVKMKDFRVANQ